MRMNTGKAVAGFARYRPLSMALLSALSLFTSCAKEPSNSQVKAVMLRKLEAYQREAGGLYSVSNGVLRVGGHSVDLMPVVESRGAQQGKNIVAMHIEVFVDGIQRPEAVFGAIGIATTPEEAIAAGLGEWYLAPGVPLFEAIGDKKPAFVIADYDVFAGALGLRGSAAVGWVDGSDAMNRKILDAALPALSQPGDLLVLDLKVMVPATGQPQSECRLSGVVSSDAASNLIALNWPRAREGYIFKQAYLLKKKKPASP